MYLHVVLAEETLFNSQADEGHWSKIDEATPFIAFRRDGLGKQ